MKFRDLKIGGRFRFVWSGYHGTKTGARSYNWHCHDGKTYALKVGSVDVEVTTTPDAEIVDLDGEG